MTRKQLGFLAVLSLVIGNTLGAGIFLIPSSLAIFGSMSLIGWILTAIGTMLIALSFARLSRLYPSTGGPYVYCRKAFGNFVGFQVAWNYWIQAWVGNAGILLSLVGYLGLAFPTLMENPWHQFFVLNGILWSLTALNAHNTHHSGSFQILSTFIKLIPLIAIIILGIPYIQMENFSPFIMPEKTAWGSILGSSTITMWALSGFESGTVPGNNVKNAASTIAKATLWGTFIISAFYIVISIVVMGIVSVEGLLNTAAPFAVVAAKIFGTWGKWVITIGAIAASIGALNGMILIQGQIPLAAAQDKLFPKIFGRTSAGGEPVAGLIISSLLITAMTLLFFDKGLVAKFTFIIIFASLAALVTFLFTVAADIVTAKSTGKPLKKWKLLGAYVAIAYILLAMWGAGLEIIGYACLQFLVSVPIYFMIKRRRKA
jgi:basic amino acid/polyamine antiporter, APA family